MWRRFRWWLSEELERLAFLVQPDMEPGRLDLSDIIEHIEPTDTPFLRSLDR